MQSIAGRYRVDLASSVEQASLDVSLRIGHDSEDLGYHDSPVVQVRICLVWKQAMILSYPGALLIGGQGEMLKWQND